MIAKALADKIQNNGSTISRHLNKLKMPGIISIRVDSPSPYYFLNKNKKEIKKFIEFLNYLKIKSYDITLV